MPNTKKRAKYSWTGDNWRPSSEAEQALDAQRDRQVQARLGVVQLRPRDLPDAVEPVAQRVRVHAQPPRRRLLLALLQVGLQGGDQVAAPQAVVVDQGAEVAVHELDQPVVADAGQEAGQPELGLTGLLAGV